MQAIFKSKWLGLALALAVVALVATASAIWLRTRQRPLTTIAEVWRWNALYPTPRPVSIRATITYYDPAWRILDVQNGGEGLFLDPEFNQVQDLRPGMLVDVTGLTSPTSVLSHMSLKPVGTAGLPAPVQATIPELAAGKHPGVLVSAAGVVRWVKTLDSRTTIKIASDSRSLNVRVLNSTPELLHIPPGSLVEVTGVASPPREAPRLPAELYVNDAAAVKVLQTGNTDLFALPVSDLEELSNSAAPAVFENAIHLRQKLISQSADGDWVIGTTAVQIHVRPLERLIADPGDTVDTVGFPSTDGRELFLADASVRITSSAGKVTTRMLLTHAGEVTALNPTEAAAGVPVRIRATVTFFDPWWRLLFVEDETGGVYVEDAPPSLKLSAGDLVELKGETRAGGFIPDVARPSLTLLGHGKLRPPFKASNEDLLGGKYDSRRVELVGVVQGYTYNPDQKRIVLDVISGSITVKAQLLTPEKIEDPSAFVDSKVRLTGVAGSLMNQNMQMMGISLFVQGQSDITTLETGPEDPFSAPLYEIKSLLRFHLPGRTQHRVHIAGTVLMQDGDTLYVRDESGVIAARLGAPISVRPGDAVHVAGFVGLGITRPILLQSVATVRGARPLPAPQRRSPEEILEGGYDSDLVSIDGIVLSSTSSSRGWELLLQSESHSFNAVLQGDATSHPVLKIEPGTLVRLTGIAEMQPSPNAMLPSMMAFRIHLRDDKDLKIIGTPPWWSFKRVIAIAGVALFTVGVTLAWVFMLKRQVRTQTSLIHQQAEGLMRAEKLASIGQLVAGVAHELNNPLAAVIGYSDLLLDDVKAENSREKLKKLGNEARRMKRIIDNLLHFARPRIRGREQIDLEQVIRGALSLHEYNLHSRGVRLELSFAPNLPKLELDEDQLKQVFLNLFNNSLQALANSRERHIRVETELENGYVVVRFGDSGPGFEEVHRAFDPFYTTKPVGQGTGLGLSICYGIVKEHGGEIYAQNLNPSGALITIKLPLRTEQGLTTRSGSSSA